jgi:polysaccharide export outer membrane protein
MEIAMPLFRTVAAAALAVALAADTYAQTPGPVPPLEPIVGTDTQFPTEWTPWSGGRYRLTPGDVLDVRFPFVPELDQTLTVQPDGYVALKDVGDLRIQGRTVPEARAAILEAYGGIVRRPEVSVILKEFEKPYFIASGEVTRPGKYELRGAMTASQAIAFAGGFTGKAKPSQVVVFRLAEGGWVVRPIDVKKMYSRRDLAEDPLLRPGDTVFVPKSAWANILPFIPRTGVYLNPFQ